MTISELLNQLERRLNALQTDRDQFMDRIIYSYEKYLSISLAALINEVPVNQQTPAFELLLRQNWDLTNGTCLSYTALSENNATALMCDLAMLVHDAKPQGLSKGALHFLMPTLHTESLCDRYPHLGPVQDIDTDQWSADPVDDIQTILKTHILGREGKYLIPLQLLIDDDIDPVFNNVYYDSVHHSAAMMKLDSEELSRLNQHSLLTRALHESQIQLESLLKDKSHLLGYLTTLCSHLQFNSVSGVGDELVAGEGTYAAIIQFADYYDRLEETEKNKIPGALHREINRLRQLTSDPAANSNAQGALNIDTCIANRRKTLLRAMSGHEAALSEIGLTGPQKNQLITQTQNHIKQLKTELKTALHQKNYAGNDNSLSLSQALLDTLDCTINPETPRDVFELITHLSPTEITELCRNESFRRHIVVALLTFDALTLLYIQLSPERLRALNSSISNEIRSIINFSASELGMLLSMVDDEKTRIIIETMTGEVMSSVSDFFEVLHQLPDEKRLIIIKAMKENPFKAIRTPKNLHSVLRHLQPNDCTLICLALKKNMAQIIRTGEEMGCVLNSLSPHQCKAICLSIKENLPGIIKSTNDLYATLIFLGPQQSLDFLDAIKDQLPNLIKSKEDFVAIFNQFSREQQFSTEQETAAFNVIKDTLPRLIQSNDDVQHLWWTFYGKKNIAFFDTIKNHLPRIIQSLEEFESILFKLNDEDQPPFFEFMKVHLSKICSTDELSSMHEYILREQFYLQYETLEPLIHDHFFNFDTIPKYRGWKLSHILDDAKINNNLCRSACVNLGWMTPEGAIKEDAPQLIISINESDPKDLSEIEPLKR